MVIHLHQEDTQDLTLEEELDSAIQKAIMEAEARQKLKGDALEATLQMLLKLVVPHIGYLRVVAEKGWTISHLLALLRQYNLPLYNTVMRSIGRVRKYIEALENKEELRKYLTVDVALEYLRRVEPNLAQALVSDQVVYNWFSQLISDLRKLIGVEP